MRREADAEERRTEGARYGLRGQAAMKLTPPKVKAAPDPRHKPFIDFCFETFRDHTGTTLIITSRDAKAVSDMLKATAAHAEEYSLERLQQMWYRYLNNRTAFEMQQDR